jgi:multiple sugar transport system permease protein/raffinose/stachyose/melibiose transport system permease protein
MSDIATGNLRPAAAADPPLTRRGRRPRLRHLTGRDRIVLTLMVGIPSLVTIAFVWLPAVASVILSFSSWQGIGGLDTIQFNGITNYHTLFTIDPQFWPAVAHNFVWLGVFILVPAPVGLFLAVQLDKRIRFSRVYQAALFLPVVLSLALIGFMTQLIFSPTQGLINGILGTSNSAHAVNWLGQPKLDLFAVLVMACWRQTGYVMILFLAGLKAVDVSQKEAAALDGTNGWQTFRYVTFPALRPINVVVAVVTIIESLRAFDIVYVLNDGTNGLELLSVLVTNNIVGQASQVGYGSAIATVLLVISLVFIIPYLIITFRKERRA